MRASTSDNTPTALFFVGSFLKLTLEANKVYAVSIQIVAKNITDSEAAMWKIEGLAHDMGASQTWVENATRLYSETPSAQFADGNVAVTAENDTTDYLKIAVTGISGKTIRWVATVQWTEVL
jgi:hypothetical protein